MDKNVSQRDTAKGLGISWSNIQEILSLRYWKYLGSTKMWSPSKVAAQDGTEIDQDYKSSAKEDCKSRDG